MINRKHKLPLNRQARAPGIGLDSICFRRRPVSDADLALMRRIDELHLRYPFAESRALQGLLLGEGQRVGHLHVGRLMKRMEIWI